MKITKNLVLMLVTLAICLSSGCCKKCPVAPQSDPADAATPQTLKSKVLYVDSYHRGYDWSDGITEGVMDVFGAKLNDDGSIDNSQSKVELKIVRMDTKRNSAEEFIKTKALEVKQIIEEFKPAVVIASDDNAFKYVIMPYYRDAELPVVFCGLNWDASIYEAPYSNTTGMVEVALVLPLKDKLQQYAKGNKIGYLSADTTTEKKNLDYYNRLFSMNFSAVYLVPDLNEWKAAFLKLQNEVDMVIFENNAGIKGWNDDEAGRFALENTKVPVGTTNPWTMQSSLIGLTKVPQEQGEWSAGTALEILAGKLPSEIPVVKNKKARAYLNMQLAKKLGVTFPIELLNQAEFTE